MRSRFESSASKRPSDDGRAVSVNARSLHDALAEAKRLLESH
jgi:hypothetical protein